MQKEIRVGDTVKKKKGYRFEGVVRSIYKKCDGERVLVDVEANSYVKEWCGLCEGMRLIWIPAVSQVRGQEQQICTNCKGKGYVEREENCQSMVHIFGVDDIELTNK